MAFEDWGEKKKVIITAVIGGTIVLLTWTLFIWRLSVVNSKTAILTEKKAEQKKKDEQLKKGNKEKVLSELQETKDAYTEKSKYIPLEENMTIFLARDLDTVIADSALGKNFRIKLGKTADAKISGRASGQKIKFQKIGLTAVGSFDDALTFLNTIEEQFPKIVDIEKFNMKLNSKESTADKMILDLQFDLKVYFREGGEAAKSKKKKGKKK